MNCTTHVNKPAVSYCDECGKPICQSCYDNFTDGKTHFCVDCFKREIKSEITKVVSLKKMVKRELIFIFIGMILGLIPELYFLISYVSQVNGVDESLISLLYLPFIFGSLITIIKKTKHRYEETRDDSGGEYSWISNLIILGITAFINLLIAPITTIVRIVQRAHDIRELNKINRQDTNFLNIIDNYIAQSLQPSAVEESSNGISNDEEISLDSILSLGIGSEAALCDNGEILRTIRTR